MYTPWLACTAPPTVKIPVAAGSAEEVVAEVGIIDRIAQAHASSLAAHQPGPAQAKIDALVGAGAAAQRRAQPGEQVGRFVQAQQVRAQVVAERAALLLRAGK